MDMDRQRVVEATAAEASAAALRRALSDVASLQVRMSVGFWVSGVRGVSCYAMLKIPAL